MRPTVDRDTLTLIFRNALAQDDVRRSPDTLIIKLAAASKMSLAAVVRVLSQFRKATLVAGKMALRRECTDDEQDQEEPAITITPPLFAWMAQWDMIHLNWLSIASRDLGEWLGVAPHFEMPSLRVLDLLPLRGRRGHTMDVSMDLVAEIVRLNARSIQDLYGVPVWELSEPLPALHLEKFVYTPWISSEEQWNDEALDNLTHCVVKLLAVDLRQRRPRARIGVQRVPLDYFAHMNVEEICFSMNYLGYHRFSAPAGTTNEYVRRISFEMKEVSVDVRDIKELHRFFPRLTCIKLNADLNNDLDLPCNLPHLQEIGEYTMSSPAMPALEGRVRLAFTDSRSTIHAWTAENVSDQYDRLMKIRDAIALVPQQLRVWATSKSKFSRSEADVRASILGFQKPTGPSVIYKHEAALAPGRKLSASWTVI